MKAHSRLEARIDTKQDMADIRKLKENIARRLHDLTLNVKQQQSQAQTTVGAAAGTRTRLPLNCLSCDKPVAGTQVG